MAEFAKKTDHPVADEEPVKKTMRFKGCQQDIDMSVIASLGNEITQILKFIHVFVLLSWSAMCILYYTSECLL